MEQIMNNSVVRKTIFDAVRRLIGRGLSQNEVSALDKAIDQNARRQTDRRQSHFALDGEHQLGTLSEHYESGGRGPGTVSGGQGDPGGVSYGMFQLASRTGTAAAFLKAEGVRWAAELGDAPGSAAFSNAWRAIAAREPLTFAEAQHAFIARSHYRPAVQAVLAETGFDLDARADALRDAVWSTAVQHGRASRLLVEALAEADAEAARGGAEHDRALVAAIYRHRAAYVRALAARSSEAVRQTLMNVVERRYPDELAVALAMLHPLG